jgi:micrococcal nuclease
MQILRTLVLAAMAAIQTAHAPVRTDPVLVRFVLDGDTIDVATIGRVRLLGIDAPEIGHRFETNAPFGREAKERLTSLIAHRWVRLEFESGDPCERSGTGAGAPRSDASLAGCKGPQHSSKDAYGRQLAYVLLEDGTFVNAVLVREGLARVSTRVPLARLEQLRRAETDARDHRRGMWSVPR